MRWLRVMLTAALVVAAAHMSPAADPPALVDNAVKMSYPPAMLAPPEKGGVGVGATGASVETSEAGAGPTGTSGTGPISAIGRDPYESKPLAGFRLGYLPPGLTPLGADSEYTSAVTVDGLTGETPAPSQPQADVAMRIFERGSTGVALVVSVLHPDAAETHDWLLAWAAGDADEVGTIDSGAGPARLLAHVGSETTAYQVIITPGGSWAGSPLIIIEGPAPLDELVGVAEGLVPL